VAATVHPTADPILSQRESHIETAGQDALEESSKYPQVRFFAAH
jgi:hypothetical protein